MNDPSQPSANPLFQIQHRLSESLIFVSYEDGSGALYHPASDHLLIDLSIAECKALATALDLHLRAANQPPFPL